MKLRRNSQSYKILKYLLVGGGAVVVSAISPFSGTQIVKGLIEDYLRKKRFEKARFLRDLKRLQVRELVDYRESADGNIKLTLTKAGKQKILAYNIDDIKLNTQRRWDGKWRLVMFDIPHYKKKVRDVFRHKLKSLNFYPIQKSVFITPHECEDEIDFISSVFDVRDCVLVFYISKFEGEEKIKNYFNLA